MQRHMALFRGAQPGGVGKGDALEADMGGRTIQRALDLDERFQRWRPYRRAREVLAGARPVIDVAGRDILKPFAGFIQKLDRIR